jgi:hypothetical protein
MLWKRIAAPRRKLLLGSGISFFLLTLGLSYLSLPLLRTTSPWPDWGALQTVGDILRHFTREEFGIFSLSPNAADTGNSALKILVQEVFTHWNVALLALLPGFGLVFSFSEPFFAGLVGCLGAAFLFLLRAESFGTDAYNITLLERFIGTGAIPLALVLGLAGRKVDPRWRRAALIGIVAIFGAAFLNRSRIDASSELTMQSYREAIAQDLPENALYISGQNEEYFAGIPTEKGLRFPIQKGGFLNRRWYVESTLPRLEPALPHTFGITHRELVEAALAAGRPVVSPDEDVFRSLKLPAEMRGILWYAPAQPDMLQTEKTLESALRLCTLVQRMKQLPEKGHGYAHQLRKYFARAYSHAGLYLQKRGNTAGAQAAHSLMVALLNPHYPQPFEQLCDQLRSAAR